MFISFILILLMSAVSVTNVVIDTSTDFREVMQNEIKQNHIKEVGHAVQRYLFTEGSYPVDLNAMVATEGFEYLGNIIDKIGYATASHDDVTLDIKYEAFTVFYKQDYGLSDADYLADNNCGTLPFSTSEQWCGNPESIWMKADNRQYYRKLAIDTTWRLDKLIQALSSGFQVNNKYPANWVLGAIADMQSLLLADAVGFSGTPESCDQMFNFDDALLSCEMLWATDGTGIRYMKRTDTDISVYVIMPYVAVDGSAKYINRNLEII